MLVTSNETTDRPTPKANPMRMHVFRPAAESRLPGVALFCEIYQVTVPIRRLAALFFQAMSWVSALFGRTLLAVA